MELAASIKKQFKFQVGPFKKLETPKKITAKKRGLEIRSLSIF
jgi:hypothetical protein